LVSWVSFFAMGLHAWVQGMAYASYYTIAWFLLFTTGIALFLGFLEILPFSFGLLYASQLAFAVETVLNSLALTNRIHSLEYERQQALADSKAKLTFLAKMSHEIRTPMNGILGMAELLFDRLKDPTDQRYIQIIRSSTTILLTIINDILDYSKIEAGKMAIEDIDFDPRGMLAQAMSVHSARTLGKPVELFGSVEAGIGAKLQGDPTRLAQIIINLTSNALKFTQRGAVHVSLAQNNEVPNGVRIMVQDSGIGIPEAQQATLFEAFQQADNSIARSYGGTGLGLAITRQLAELMGGKVQLASVEGEGSRFWVDLQLPSLQPAPELPDMGQARLLLIENSHLLAQALEAAASRWGLALVVVADGAAAWAQLQMARSQGQAFDLIVIKEELRPVSGIDTGIKLKALGLKAPMVLLYHNATATVPTSALAHGFASIHPKPYLLDDYQAIFAGALKPPVVSQRPAEAVLPKSNLPSQPLQILVAEDNGVNQLVIKGLLHKLNHNITLTDNGREALQTLQAAPGKFDLVLMDCEMPIMNGFTATREIRSWERSRHQRRIPIVALTAHILPEQREACFAAGMDELLSKPVEVNKLRRLLLSYSAAKAEAQAAERAQGD
jgi:signal transduction histidine kinase/CheY-like chemotaxis protein